TVRLFGVNSTEQRLLFDQALKYQPGLAPARRVTGNLLSLDWQYASAGRASHSLVTDLRISTFPRDFIRGPLGSTPDTRFGAFSASWRTCRRATACRSRRPPISGRA